MSTSNFEDIAKKEFGFLVSDYNFQLSSCRKEKWGYELKYLNNIVGVKIVYEYREAYVFITIYKLNKGALIENPIFINTDTELHGYGLDDIINIRNPSDLLKPSYKYSSEFKFNDKVTGLASYVLLFANNLKKYASDVLSGDFKIFIELDKIVKARVMMYQ